MGGVNLLQAVSSVCVPTFIYSHMSIVVASRIAKKGRVVIAAVYVVYPVPLIHY